MCCLYVCVFFKHETAYEMRISDWSSDGVLFRSYHDHWSTDHLDTRALPPLPSECRRSRHHMGDKAKRGRPPVATPPIHSNHSIGILDRREMAARCHPLVPGSSVCTPTPSGVRSSQLSRPSSARTTSRSEKQTYELQSLIRNSYAVFCLKK